MSAARLGLWKACLTFEENRDTKFSTYAVKCITNEVLLVLRREAKHRLVFSLDQVQPSDNDDVKDSFNLGALISAPDDVFDQAIVAAVLSELKNYPTLSAFVFSDKTQVELAKELGCSQAKISRKIRYERRKLRTRLRKLGILDESK